MFFFRIREPATVFEYKAIWGATEFQLNEELVLKEILDLNEFEYYL